MFNSFHLGFLKIRSQKTLINTYFNHSMYWQGFHFAVINTMVNFFLNFMNFTFVPTKIFQHGTLTLFVETLIPTLWNCQRTLKHEFKMNLPKVSLVSYELCKMIPYDKVHIFWEGHKICEISTIDLSYHVVNNGQIWDGYFANFCGLLRIYEL